MREGGEGVCSENILIRCRLDCGYGDIWSWMLYPVGGDKTGKEGEVADMAGDRMILNARTSLEPDDGKTRSGSLTSL